MRTSAALQSTAALQILVSGPVGSGSMADSANALARKVLAADERRPEAVLLLPSGSSSRAIADAYKKLAIKLHPDKFKSAIAGEVFQRIR